MSGHVRERLLKAPRVAGRVHSAYARTLNLLWHDGRLLSLQGPGTLLAPFAAAVSAPPCGPESGMPVRREDDCIRIGPLLVTWGGSAAVDMSLRPAEGGAGFLPATLASRADEGVAPSLLSPGGVADQRRLSHGIRTRDAAGVFEAATDLIGLGEGLTPAGDDCLVGALAVLWRWAAAWLEGNREILDKITADSEARTTRLGCEFLRHAAAGSFTEAIVRLVSARSAMEAVTWADALVGVGASSGADTLRGMRLALEALQA